VFEQVFGYTFLILQKGSSFILALVHTLKPLQLDSQNLNADRTHAIARPQTGTPHLPAHVRHDPPHYIVHRS
jgi:hypothetical protein